MIPAILFAVVGLLAVVVVQSGRPAAETRLVLLSYGAHLVAALAQVAITVNWYGGGDMTAYAWHAERVRPVLDYDGWSGAWGLFRVALHQRGELPMEIFAEGTSTGAMIAISSLLIYSVGGSLVAACVFLAVLALLSRLLLLRVHLEHANPDELSMIRTVALLLPSVTFWTSGVAKEAVAFIGLGPVVWGLNQLLGSVPAPQRGRAVAAILLGGTLVWTVKPYVLIAVAVAAMSWVYAARFSSSRRPLARAAGAVAAALGVLWLVGEAFPAYNLDAVAEQAANLQATGARVHGGSNYDIGNVGTLSFAGRLFFAPVALFSALLRPFFFEVRNVLMAATALETTLMALVIARIAWVVGPRRATASILARPFLVFASAFTLVLAVGIGIATSNAGTLIRYRTPLMISFASVVVCLDRVRRQRPTAPVGPPARVARRRSAAV